MRQPNYTHVHYAWAVIKHGSVAAAARKLHLAPQTISGQIKLLETQLGCPLFERRGKQLVPTDGGRLLADYAETIFSRGEEFLAALRGVASPGGASIKGGVSEVLPKTVTWQVLAPLFEREPTYQITCHEGTLQYLIDELASNRLDLVLASSTAPPSGRGKTFNHLLGECGIGFFAAPTLSRRLARNFPESLDHAPMLMTTDRSPNRNVLEAWLESAGLTPKIVGEFDDSALLKTFARQGVGAFAAPLAVANEICKQYGVRQFGVADGLKARFYAITTSRLVRHPAIALLTEHARANLFR